MAIEKVKDYFKTFNSAKISAKRSPSFLRQNSFIHFLPRKIITDNFT